jgi:GrpB-like predicted nucleotidyltransferase (UPF0157 family)
VSQEPHAIRVGNAAFDHFTIIEPDASWPESFARIARDIAGIATDNVRRIDHIGSTSVPGLRSKDRIDIQVTVDDLGGVSSWIGALETKGFVADEALARDHNPPQDPYAQEKVFLHRSLERPLANVHVREWHRGTWVYALLVRDYLRALTTVAQAYGEVKARLAEVARGTRTTYAYVKDPVCDLLHASAIEWAIATGWNESQYDARNLDEWR